MAIGYLAINPIKIQPAADASAVAVKTAPWSILSASGKSFTLSKASVIGLTNKIYAIDKKVVNPPMISLR